MHSTRASIQPCRQPSTPLSRKSSGQRNKSSLPAAPPFRALVGHRATRSGGLSALRLLCCAAWLPRPQRRRDASRRAMQGLKRRAGSPPLRSPPTIADHFRIAAHFRDAPFRAWVRHTPGHHAAHRAGSSVPRRIAPSGKASRCAAWRARSSAGLYTSRGCR